MGPSRPPFWLLARREAPVMEPFTLGLAGGERALAVFSFEEEAELFLRFGATEGGWRSRRTGAGELLSVLADSSSPTSPCAGVETIVLDPSPEIVVGEAAGLVRTSRRSFMDRLMGRGRHWFESTRSSGDYR